MSDNENQELIKRVGELGLAVFQDAMMASATLPNAEHGDAFVVGAAKFLEGLEDAIKDQDNVRAGLEAFIVKLEESPHEKTAENTAYSGDLPREVVEEVYNAKMIETTRHLLAQEV